MPCPFYSKADNECSLLSVARLSDDDHPEQEEPEAVDLALCLGRGDEHRTCAIFRRRAVEQTRAF